MREQPYVATARAARPRRFEDVLGQQANVRVLRQALLQGRIGRVQLYSGPRGTGKTSLARLFAATLNCLSRVESPEGSNPCGVCTSCRRVFEGNDDEVLEIDAASKGGVDNVRDILEIAHQQPRPGCWRVLILDEAHMLSPQAQNALLKLLEQPPDRFLVMLCTTDPGKLLVTLRSRCMQFPVRPIPTQEVRASLARTFAQAEQPVDDTVLTLLAVQAQGSLRDVQQVADQLTTQAQGQLITDRDLELYAGIVSTRMYKELGANLMKAWTEQGPERWFQYVERIWADGVALDTFFYQALPTFLRDARIAVVSRHLPEPTVAYMTGIPHAIWRERLSLDHADLDLFQQSWDEQARLLGGDGTVIAKIVIEFWFVKAWDARRWNRGETLQQVAGGAAR
jgi:DNA polymerase III subunit gamma/tau